MQEKYLPGRSGPHRQAALQDRNPENGSDYIQNLFLNINCLVGIVVMRVSLDKGVPSLNPSADKFY